MGIKKFDQRSRPVMTKTVLKHTPTPPIGVGFIPLVAQVKFYYIYFDFCHFK